MNTATGAVKQKEETMKILSVAELLCLTRMELLELRRTLERQVDELHEGSTEWYEAHYTLANLRQVLNRRDPSPTPPHP